MRRLRQFLIIAAFSWAGEALRALVPLPIPASVYGLTLLFAALATGRVRLCQVKDAADFLIAVMPVMFIPAAVGLLDSWDQLRPALLPVAVITLASTVVVMGATGRVTQRALRGGKKSGGERRA